MVDANIGLLKINIYFLEYVWRYALYFPYALNILEPIDHQKTKVTIFNKEIGFSLAHLKTLFRNFLLTNML